jgi:hypothetical protein
MFIQVYDYTMTMSRYGALHLFLFAPGIKQLTFHVPCNCDATAHNFVMPVGKIGIRSILCARRK